MDLFWIFFYDNPQLFYQFLNIPFALLLYYLARQGHLSIVSRYSITKKCISFLGSFVKYNFLTFIFFRKARLFDAGRLRPGYRNDGSIQCSSVLQCQSCSFSHPLSGASEHLSMDFRTTDVLANVLALLHPVPTILASGDTRLKVFYEVIL